ncbi:ScbR family autoregulator-binding transcription factor [Streptomyces fuscichromogenes]|uniref:TetR family transcriptional regulator n=1 Tax=Streptomyces fuscichromogenes TaxID=1324013 RepID=A0A917XNX6_9ACTN|nr:ScbR family autoregulator-binding transcription factor [Streptomyces fuscichromogenes]GGN45138.1 TetR family transcriptional regulator [Streptomyces fuscichromogenes]
MPSDSVPASPRPSRTANAKGQAFKQERALRTRRLLLDAAAEAFADKGFPGVTILDIAELAEMTKGAVYFHFANKEAVALALADEFYERLAELVDSARQGSGSPLEAVRGILTRTATAFRDDKIIQAGARLQVEQAFIEAALPVPYVKFTSVLTEVLTEAHEAGQLRPDCVPDALGRVLTSAFFGVQHISWVLHDRKDLPERIHEVLETTLRPNQL